MVITCVQDTHVLRDAEGEAVLSGSEAEMNEYAEMTRAHGGECEVVAIAACDVVVPEWHWEQKDWGD